MDEPEKKPYRLTSIGAICPIVLDHVKKQELSWKRASRQVKIERKRLKAIAHGAEPLISEYFKLVSWLPPQDQDDLLLDIRAALYRRIDGIQASIKESIDRVLDALSALVDDDDDDDDPEDAPDAPADAPPDPDAPAAPADAPPELEEEAVADLAA